MTLATRESRAPERHLPDDRHGRERRTDHEHCHRLGPHRRRHADRATASTVLLTVNECEHGPHYGGNTIPTSGANVGPLLASAVGLLLVRWDAAAPAPASAARQGHDHPRGSRGVTYASRGGPDEWRRRLRRRRNDIRNPPAATTSPKYRRMSRRSPPSRPTTPTPASRRVDRATLSDSRLIRGDHATRGPHRRQHALRAPATSSTRSRTCTGWCAAATTVRGRPPARSSIRRRVPSTIESTCRSWTPAERRSD